jgi:isopropylmalate/homocitrate/citramalate synthase
VIQFELQVLQTFVLFKNDPIEQLEQFVEGE